MIIGYPISRARRMFSSMSSPRGPSEPGTHGTPAAFMARMADTLSPIRRIADAGGPTNVESGRLYAFREIGVLGQKTIARMNTHRVGDFRRGNDGGHVQIAFGGRRGADADGLVGQQHVFQVVVGGRMNGNRLDVEFTTRSQYAQCDLAAIRNKKFLKHRSVNRRRVGQ